VGGRKRPTGETRRPRGPVLTRPEMARDLGVSRATVERLAADGAMVPAGKDGREFVYSASGAARAVTGEEAPCMKCWADSAAPDGRPGTRRERYARLIVQRDQPEVPVCTPEEQAGLAADECARCRRKTVHELTGMCQAC
jgi:hypothetical protein